MLWKLSEERSQGTTTGGLQDPSGASNYIELRHVLWTRVCRSSKIGTEREMGSFVQVGCCFLQRTKNIMCLNVACWLTKCHFSLYFVLLCFPMVKTSSVARFCKCHRFSCQVDTSDNRYSKRAVWRELHTCRHLTTNETLQERERSDKFKLKKIFWK